VKELWETLRQLIGVLPHGAKPFYLWYSIVTGLLAILDTAALALLLLTVSPLVSGEPVDLPLLGRVEAGGVAWVAIVVCALFILKGVLAVALHWYATRRFARYELQVGDSLFQSYMRASWEKRSQMSTAEVTRLVDISMANTNLGFILPLSQIPGNALTFIAVLAVLIVGEPITALITFVYLGFVSLLMVFVVSRRARIAGRHNREFSYRVATIMTEMVDALKEVTLRDKLDEVSRVVSRNRQRATRARANMSFLAIVPKYGFEAALIGGFLLVGGTSFLIGGGAAAAASVAFFAVTGFRMIPAMNGIQTSLTSASANEVFARDVIRGLESADHIEPGEARFAEPLCSLPQSPKHLELKNVCFRYPGRDEDVLKDLSLSLPFGQSLAIVGPSGAGKSTLIDILLGLSRPTSGVMEIDGIPLSRVMVEWRRRVGYVPQRVALFDASIAQNVALTWENDFDSDQVVRALRRAHLMDLVDRGEGIDAKVGERGQSLSGGQQQRLGIARALYSEPLVMVMDEATSALDTATESRVTESIRELQGQVTFVTVAHRLSTIRDYDQVCYLDGGRILGAGTFDDVVARVPEFRLQATLAGLVQD